MSECALCDHGSRQERIRLLPVVDKSNGAMLTWQISELTYLRMGLTPIKRYAKQYKHGRRYRSFEQIKLEYRYALLIDLMTYIRQGYSTLGH